MATRFYITSSSSTMYGLPAITPAVDAAWQETAALVRRRARVTYDPLATAFASITATSTATTPELHAQIQAISDPIEAQTISGTVTGQFRCLESASAGTGTVAIGIRVVSDAGTVRGTLLAVTGNTNAGSTTPPDFATSLTNRQLTGASSSNPLTLSSVTAVAGDRIVFEIGTRDIDTSTSRTYSVNIGSSSSAGDLPADNTTTTAAAPFVELSGTITFMSLRPPTFTDMAEQQDGGDVIASGIVPKGRA